jgi:hypothetical protein
MPETQKKRPAGKGPGRPRKAKKGETGQQQQQQQQGNAATAAAPSQGPAAAMNVPFCNPFMMQQMMQQVQQATQMQQMMQMQNAANPFFFPAQQMQGFSPMAAPVPQQLQQQQHQNINQFMIAKQTHEQILKQTQERVQKECQEKLQAEKEQFTHKLAEARKEEERLRNWKNRLQESLRREKKEHIETKQQLKEWRKYFNQNTRIITPQDTSEDTTATGTGTGSPTEISNGSTRS